MYDLLQYSDNYSMTLGFFWNYYRDQISNFTNDVNNFRINNNKTKISTSFEYQTKLVQITADNNSRLNAETIVPLEYLNNFWRFLDLLLINCKTKFELR